MELRNVDALTVVRALVLSRVFLFLSAYSIRTESAMGALSMNTWAGSLLLMDIPLLILAWAIKPDSEDFLRAYGLVETLVLSIIVWLIMWGLPNAGLILMVNLLIVIALARPNSKDQLHESSTEEQVEPLRVRCIHCGSTYSYRTATVSEGLLECQNCNKPFGVDYLKATFN